MNIILLDPKNTLADGMYGLSFRQQTHISKVIKAKQGDVLRVGLLNGKIGEGVYQPPVENQAGYIHALTLFSSHPKHLLMVL